MADTSAKSSNMWAWIFGLAALVLLALGVLFVILWRKEKAKNKPATTGKTNTGTTTPGLNVSVNTGGAPAPNGGPAASAPGSSVVANNSPAVSVA